MSIFFCRDVQWKSDPDGFAATTNISVSQIWDE